MEKFFENPDSISEDEVHEAILTLRSLCQMI